MTQDRRGEEYQVSPSAEHFACQRIEFGLAKRSFLEPPEYDASVSGLFLNPKQTESCESESAHGAFF